MRARFLVIPFLAALAIAGSAPAAFAATAPKGPSATEIVREAAPAVVLVNAYEKVTPSSRRYQRVSLGSGFFVNTYGYLITNRHVVSDEYGVYTVDDGEDERVAEVVYRDEVHDIAVLKVSGRGHESLILSDDAAEEGDKVIGIGNAEGERVDSVSKGKVSELDVRLTVREGKERSTLEGMIKTTARQYHGDSGGPLLNGLGEVIGINTAIGSSRKGGRVSYALPIAVAFPILSRLGVTL